MRDVRVRDPASARGPISDALVRLKAENLVLRGRCWSKPHESEASIYTTAFGILFAFGLGELARRRGLWTPLKFRLCLD